MGKNMIVGIAVVIGILTIGTLSASAADLCENCTDKQAYQQFTRETTGLASVLMSKDIELRVQYSYDAIDTNKVDLLEAELKELKGKINAAAQKHGIAVCSLS